MEIFNSNLCINYSVGHVTIIEIWFAKFKNVYEVLKWIYVLEFIDRRC